MKNRPLESKCMTWGVPGFCVVPAVQSHHHFALPVRQNNKHVSGLYYISPLETKVDGWHIVLDLLLVAASAHKKEDENACIRSPLSNEQELNCLKQAEAH